MKKFSLVIEYWAEKPMKMLRRIWDTLLVWLGFSVRIRARYTYCRAHQQTCQVHHIPMQRVGKYAGGAYYHCRQCRDVHKIPGGVNRFMPIG